MFNGIIYNQGKLTEISKNKDSIVIGILTNLKVTKMKLDHLLVVTAHV